MASSKIKRYDSASIENQPYNDDFYLDYLDICKLNKPPVQSHKNKLGKQNYCYFNGEFRFWVWEHSDWRVFVNNKKGICFEYRDGISKDAIHNAWEEYKKLMTKENK